MVQYNLSTKYNNLGRYAIALDQPFNGQYSRNENAQRRSSRQRSCI